MRTLRRILCQNNKTQNLRKGPQVCFAHLAAPYLYPPTPIIRQHALTLT